MATATISHIKSDTIADWNGTVTVGNSTGGTNTNDASNLIRPSDWNSSHAFALSMSYNDFPEGEFLESFPFVASISTMSAPANGSWYFEPIYIPFWLESGYFMVGMANAAGFSQGAVFSTTPATATRDQTVWNHLALYKQGDGASASSLALYGASFISFMASQRVSETSTVANTSMRVSNNLTINMPYAWNSSGGVSYSDFTTSGSKSVAVSSMVSSSLNTMLSAVYAYATGSRVDVIPWGANIPAGNYYLAHMINSSSSSNSAGANIAAGTLFSTQSRLGANEINFQAWRMLGSSTTADSTAAQGFKGALRTTTSLATASLVQSDILYTTGRLWWAHGEKPIP